MGWRENWLIFFSVIICFSLLKIDFYGLDDKQSNKINLGNSATQITVSCAASLKNIMEEIKPLYEQKYSQTQLIYNFGSSGSLQRQIEQGAPVDVFISAADKQINALEKKGLLLEGTRYDLVSNKIVLIVPKNHNKNKVNITNFTDLTNTNITKIALGEPQSVPAGKYAQEVLHYYKITEQINAKAVYGKDVRQVLNYVATGNVDAGIVYLTDAKIEDEVKVVTTAPSGSHSPVIYPIAVVKDSKNPQESKQLINFLSASEIQTIFTKYGFSK
ncbi:molybdate ABC transporter substrate-binding protein [Cyanobacterium aponinum]|uniref:molybdate ABC transporter substrate-binding protein n=1 Tax=Cyanobacterium aponinum TaxID=379064 RepID=UPI000C12CE71|nr:molybdate ABC transporter substrate-binding protein [Cyanobacterium aponinum]PHV61566.1 molybdate ABC transporter substrate-binding protein [Cyanobacterium aponinum IPPAS B-1201]